MLYVSRCAANRWVFSADVKVVDAQRWVPKRVRKRVPDHRSCNGERSTTVEGSISSRAWLPLSPSSILWYLPKGDDALILSANEMPSAIHYWQFKHVTDYTVTSSWFFVCFHTETYSLNAVNIHKKQKRNKNKPLDFKAFQLIRLRLF